MAIVYLGLGSNLGDRQGFLDRALGFLRAHEAIQVLKVSSVIETQPQGVPPQPLFLNAAAEIKTDLLPLELLSQLKIIERRLGRRAQSDSLSPRPIDLDILFYGDGVIFGGKSLTIPHPRLSERRFVLEPLAEIAPDFVHPKLKKSVRELLQNLTHAPSSEHQAASTSS